MTKPCIAKRGPYVIECEPGTYAWCSCGKSKKQPYCDGAHAGTGMIPVIETVTEKKTVAWCGCKHAATKPFCDGAHNKLPTA